MSKLSDRLNDYQTQMSIYAEQHKIILANDVLDMIEQLQEDLEDYVEKVVAELEEMKSLSEDAVEYEKRSGNIEDRLRAEASLKDINKIIEIVRKGGME